MPSDRDKAKWERIAERSRVNAYGTGWIMLFVSPALAYAAAVAGYREFGVLGVIGGFAFGAFMGVVGVFLIRHNKRREK